MLSGVWLGLVALCPLEAEPAQGAVPGAEALGAERGGAREASLIWAVPAPGACVTASEGAGALLGVGQEP